MELQYICLVCGHVHDDEKEGRTCWWNGGLSGLF